MITEGITIQGLRVISLALIPTEWWEAARQMFNTVSTTEACLTIFAMAALIISVILVFWASTERKRFEDRLEQKIAKLTKLRQEIAELNREQIGVLEEITGAGPPRKEMPASNPQEIEALSELGKRAQ